MSQLASRRIALRAVQFALLAVGVFLLLFLFTRQAHAATDDSSPPVPLVTSAVSAGGSSSAAVPGAEEIIAAQAANPLVRGIRTKPVIARGPTNPSGARNAACRIRSGSGSGAADQV